MRKSNDDVWIFLPDARAGRNDACGGDRYRYGVMYDVLLDTGQTTSHQINPVCQYASRVRLAF
jgi:hypothetical protein